MLTVLCVPLHSACENSWQIIQNDVISTMFINSLQMVLSCHCVHAYWEYCLPILDMPAVLAWFALNLCSRILKKEGILKDLEWLRSRIKWVIFKKCVYFLTIVHMRHLQSNSCFLDEMKSTEMGAALKDVKVYWCNLLWITHLPDAAAVRKNKSRKMPPRRICIDLTLFATEERGMVLP